ncbi:Cytochrome b-c1 complex subunit 8 [Theobroma cacao]|nr:Cytochrome b-c1 complex subunit 8 [Theobroma cacao]
MGKHPAKMRAVIYTLSPFQQKILSGLWKDLPSKITHKVTENWISATLLLGPLVGTYTYVQNYQEKEKLAHRVMRLATSGARISMSHKDTHVCENCRILRFLSKGEQSLSVAGP